MLLIDTAHEGCRWRQHVVDKDEDGLFRRQLDALTNHVDELADGEVGRDQVLLLVNGGNVGLFDLLADDGDAVRVLVADAVGLGLAGLEGMFVLKLGAHCLVVSVVWWLKLWLLEKEEERERREVKNGWR